MGFLLLGLNSKAAQRRTIMSDYKHPEVLVTTRWVLENLDRPGQRLIEVDVDTACYDQGHIPGAVAWNWQTQLQDPIRRDLVEKLELERLLGESGILPDTTILLYGDNNNWFAAYAFWQLKYYGHKDVKLVNGGRKKWASEGLRLTTDPVHVEPTTYRAADSDESIRARKEHVQEIQEKQRRAQLVDVRSVDEFTGKILAPPGLAETALRAGHIPGAINIPWVQATNEDGTFRCYEELRALYESKGVVGADETIAYCRIGERSSHTWFVLKYLLGYENVRNYDGSWTEWGNLVGAPIVNPSAAKARAAAACQSD
jgi:thiosulfate/3-mercaptopyruvate sulfurtransferase